jgi:hypothetical protein
MPVLVCLGYILTLRHGKPRGYDSDVIERLFTGDGFSPESKSLTHPIGKE